MTSYFDRFTERARRVVSLASKAARELNHDYVGPEHILLGILADGSGVASQVISAYTTQREVRNAVEGRLTRGRNMVTMGQLPFSKEGKKILEQASIESEGLGVNYIGTDQLLLALAKEEGLPGEVLSSFQITYENARRGVLEALGMDDEVITIPEESKGLAKILEALSYQVQGDGTNVEIYDGPHYLGQFRGGDTVEINYRFGDFGDLTIIEKALELREKLRTNGISFSEKPSSEEMVQSLRDRVRKTNSLADKLEDKKGETK